MKVDLIFRRLLSMPPSRRRQWLAFKRDRLITAAFHARRLRRVGTGTIVQKPLFWTPEFIELGARILIWPGCRIEGVDRYGNCDFSPLIRLGDGVSLQQHCHIVIAGELEIGCDTTISSNVFITDSDHGYDRLGLSVLEQPLAVRRTSIGRCCFIGVGARVLAGTMLGDHCVVAANAVVRGAYPDACVIAGAPARIIRRFDPKVAQWRKTNSKGDYIS